MRGYPSPLTTLEPTDDRRRDEEAGLSPIWLGVEKSESPIKELSDDSAIPNRWQKFWMHLKGTHNEKVEWLRSLRVIFSVSWLNGLLVFVPLSWVAHFRDDWSDGLTLALCFIAIIPLEKLFDWGGEQLASYCPRNVGVLIVITLKNAVEAALAIILVARCEMQLLQSTIVGVVLLHILLVPGASFLTGGAHVLEQELRPHHSGLNPSLLSVGVMALVVPVGLFAATDKTALVGGSSPDSFVSDALRQNILRISRGFSVVLLAIYIGSRIYITRPPRRSSSVPHPYLESEERFLKDFVPQANPGVCIILVLVTLALMGVTAEFLVDSIKFIREESDIQEEWFGLILLPVISFSGDGLLSAVVYFRRDILECQLTSEETELPKFFSDARAIDPSIQFLLFWMPFVTLLAWWIDKPMTLLFDLFEVVSLVGTCFLVNAVIADGKTNWVEGMILVCFYTMIALAAWYYTGQPEIRVMDACESVAAALVAEKLPNS